MDRHKTYTKVRHAIAETIDRQKTKTKVQQAVVETNGQTEDLQQAIVETYGQTEDQNKQQAIIQIRKHNHTSDENYF